MKTGITFSTFDLLHAGHIKMLEEAKQNCDYLICGLQTDPTINRPEKNKPVQSVVERYIQLKGCRYVDEIIPYQTEQDLEDILKAFKIVTRVTLQLKNYPNSTQASSPLGPFDITSATTKVDTRARARAVSLKIENTGASQSWRLGTFRLDTQPDGRR